MAPSVAAYYRVNKAHILDLRSTVIALPLNNGMALGK